MQINKLFQRMKDRAIVALAEEKTVKRNLHYNNLLNLQELTIDITDKKGVISFDAVIRNINRFNISKSALFMFESPLKYDLNDGTDYPENINLKCIQRKEGVYALPKERQNGPLVNIFTRKEISEKCKGYSVFSVFYGEYLYGFLMCELTDDIYDRGEFVAQQLARTIFIERMTENMEK